MLIKVLNPHATGSLRSEWVGLMHPYNFLLKPPFCLPHHQPILEIQSTPSKKLSKMAGNYLYSS